MRTFTWRHVNNALVKELGIMARIQTRNIKAIIEAFTYDKHGLDFLRIENNMYD